ncbi:hypothetical protein A5906_14005 [Bradyrhizobium sacchari]|uniref:Uncharacterized protein n=1 Tax=Bradyrhizobium sacchari TaxID=1399419 RepID=A0A560KC48_9BRAD|nr:hypothetical protein A5906_14005 [Bradyrhizobium sacchari]TWB64569.1 hypothetical protein FBZ94_102109 [Bradyrhizobium sacchari]TWB80893.1 hypothetical protein FBZ95_102110 [Bradyrhizobium sacchari]
MAENRPIRVLPFDAGANLARGAGAGPRGFVDGEAVVDVMPILTRRLGGIDAQSFHRIDQLERAADLRALS